MNNQNINQQFNNIVEAAFGAEASSSGEVQLAYKATEHTLHWEGGSEWCEGSADFYVHDCCGKPIARFWHGDEEFTLSRDQLNLAFHSLHTGGAAAFSLDTDTGSYMCGWMFDDDDDPYLHMEDMENENLTISIPAEAAHEAFHSGWELVPAPTPNRAARRAAKRNKKGL